MTASVTPDSLGDWPTLLWVGIALIAAAWLTLLALCAAAARTPNAASAHDEPTTPTRANCAVALCDDEPTVHIYASDEFWSFCVEHGTPYLTEDLAS
jgi:hypothetical protein